MFTTSCRIVLIVFFHFSGVPKMRLVQFGAIGLLMQSKLVTYLEHLGPHPANLAPIVARLGPVRVSRCCQIGCRNALVAIDTRLTGNATYLVLAVCYQ